MDAEIEVKNVEPIISKLVPSLVFDQLQTSEEGLTTKEAGSRLEQYGQNTIKEKQSKSLLLQLLSNFTSMMAILLWISGSIAFIARMPELGIAIWTVNLINGVFSFIQEYRAGKATEALKGLLASYARVVRDGQEIQINTENLVPGDIILVEEGDKISADARLVSSSELTGEPIGTDW